MWPLFLDVLLKLRLYFVPFLCLDVWVYASRCGHLQAHYIAATCTAGQQNFAVPVLPTCANIPCLRKKSIPFSHGLRERVLYFEGCRERISACAFSQSLDPHCIALFGLLLPLSSRACYLRLKKHFFVRHNWDIILPVVLAFCARAFFDRRTCMLMFFLYHYTSSQACHLMPHLWWHAAGTSSRARRQHSFDSSFEQEA